MANSTSLSQLVQADVPTVVVLGDVEAVVLGVSGEATIAVWSRGSTATYSPATPAIAVADPERQLAVLYQAFLDLNRCRTEVQQECIDDATRHAQILTDIRAYVIRKHHEGVFSRSRLNDLLQDAGLPTYAPTTTLTFAITGQFELSASTAAVARQRTIHMLKVKLSQRICDLEPGSIDSRVQVENITSTKPDAAPLHLRVTYVLSGSASVASGDREHARVETRRAFEPDLSAIEGLVPNSSTYQTEVTAEIYETSEPE